MAKQRSKIRHLTLQTPVGGVVRSTAFQAQPPFTAYDALNMWPVESNTGRARLSTRPGTRRVTNADVGSASTIRLLKSMVAADASGVQRILVASAGGNLYTWDGGASWTAVNMGGMSLATDRPLQAAVFGNKMYIADNGTTTGADGFLGTVLAEHASSGTITVNAAPTKDTFHDGSTDWVAAGVATGDILHIRSGSNEGYYELTDVQVGYLEFDEDITGGDITTLSWRILDPNDLKFHADSVPSYAGVANDWVLYILSGDNAGTYDVTAISSQYLTLDPTPSSNAVADITDLSWAIVRSTKVYDHLAGTVSRLTATRGTVPHGCKLVAVWQDRLVLANDGVSPQVWYMSASGDPTDYQYAEEQAGAAVAGNNFRGGEISEPVSCLIAHNRECILMGGDDSFWVMRGDPMDGGIIERLSSEIGPISAHAWTHTTDTALNLLMLTRDGIYAMPEGCGQAPTIVSRDRIPDELLEIDPDTTDVFLEYDVRFRGVLIKAGSSYWWYDVQNGGFWPVTFAFTAGATVAFLEEHTPSATADRSAVMLGLSNGLVAHFDNNVVSDAASSEFNYYVEYGPFRLTQDKYQRALIQLSQMAHDGDQIHMYVRTGKEAEQVAEKTSGQYMEISFTGAAAHHYTWSPRLSGHAAVVRIEKELATSLTKTSVEEVQLVLADAGRLK